MVSSDLKIHHAVEICQEFSKIDIVLLGAFVNLLGRLEDLLGGKKCLNVSDLVGFNL